MRISRRRGSLGSGFLLEIDAVFIFPRFAVNIIAARLARKQQSPRAAGWQARARQDKAKGKPRQGDTSHGRASRDMPCLPAGATTCLTFVRPVLRPGPAGTNETVDLPTRDSARLGAVWPVPLRTRARVEQDEAGNSKEMFHPPNKVEKIRLEAPSIVSLSRSISNSSQKKIAKLTIRSCSNSDRIIRI